MNQQKLYSFKVLIVSFLCPNNLSRKVLLYQITECHSLMDSIPASYLGRLDLNFSQEIGRQDMFLWFSLLFLGK